MGIGNLGPFVKQLSKEKDLDPEVIKTAIEQAILSASRKSFSSYNNARPCLDLETGELKIYATKKIVKEVKNERTEIGVLKSKLINPDLLLGDEVEVEIDPQDFGRIAAQSVRQGIIQRLRDAERDKIYEEYADRVGQLVSGVVQRYERRDLILTIGKVEALLPRNETASNARYRPGDRLKCLVVDVKKYGKGPIVRVSRTHPNLVLKLFEQEVPEIVDGTVKIVSIAREPGVRTKVAVRSTNPDVDPLGACVGMKGSRVQMVVRELENEKIDIVPWSQNPETFIAAALNPAKILKVEANEAERRALVIVTQETLSLAIGKKGVNTRLASRLTGWKLDVRAQAPMEELIKEEELQKRYLEDFLRQIEGLPAIAREALLKSAYNTVEKLAQCSPEQVLNFTNDDLDLAHQLVEGAREYLEALTEMRQQAAGGEQQADQAAAPPAPEKPDNDAEHPQE
ncbi:MAG: transcription termination factor NusA [Candidatus Sumerlaeia bacterium]